MDDKVDALTEGQGLGLLANGSSGRWDIAVDESLDGNEWFMEIDGPQTYLVFQLVDLEVVRTALRFLRSPSGSEAIPRSDGGPGDLDLTLGRFGSSSVSLVWDNEDFPRCFLVIIGPQGRYTLRLSLAGEDLEMFRDALRQVVEDLPEPPQ
jgi:hypothetical protein